MAQAYHGCRGQRSNYSHPFLIHRFSSSEITLTPCQALKKCFDHLIELRSQSQTFLHGIISDHSFWTDMHGIWKNFINLQKTVQHHIIINRCRTTTQGIHSVFTTLSTDYDASFVYYQCTFTSTRGRWILPGGGARIIRHSLLGQSGVRKSVSCSGYTLRIELV